MKKIIILIIIICSFTNLYSQDLSKIKHIELISEPSDSMALINKNDVDVINEVFHKKNTLDSLNTINKSLISDLKIISLKKDEIILSQDYIIKNDSLIKTNLQNMISNNNEIIKEQERVIKKEKRQKTF